MSDSILNELWEARTSGRLVDPNRMASFTDLEEAYRLQAEQIQLSGATVIGWKIGAASAPALASLGLSEPIIGPVFSNQCYPSGSSIPITSVHRPKLETEIALRIGADIDEGMASRGRSVVESAVSAALPAFEIVGSRFRCSEPSAPQIVVDGGGNTAVVVGEPAHEMISQIADAEVQVSIDGKCVASGSSRTLIWENLLDSITWIVQQPALRDRGLRQGDLVMTGTCAPLIPIAPGQHSSADFGIGKLLTCEFSDSLSL